MILADTARVHRSHCHCTAGGPPDFGYAQADRLQTTSINCLELLSGAAAGRRGDNIRRLLAAIPVIPLDRDAAERAADVRRELERTGVSIGMGDSLIAGIALAHGLPLFTRNRKHFARVPILTLVEIEEA